jgi:hypothetical protein
VRGAHLEPCKAALEPVQLGCITTHAEDGLQGTKIGFLEIVGFLDMTNW